MEILFTRKNFNYTLNCYDKNNEIIETIEKNTSTLSIGDSFKVVLGTNRFRKYQITSIDPYRKVKAILIDHKGI